MQKYNYPSQEEWEAIITRPSHKQADLNALVSEVFNAVKTSGEQALYTYTKKFDGVSIQSLTVSKEEIDHALQQVPQNLKTAITTAADNIKKFHQIQSPKDESITISTGVECWRKSRAIEKVGLYIPGGTAPLFSTVLMLGIPAKIAGCKEIVLCTPPDKNGNIHPAILFTAHLIGITKIVKVGGIQAIAAMSIGTTNIPAVYKIFGPGNQYVTAAKQHASLLGIAIDMPAGPSELLVFADESGDPDFIASDLLSQAEHGADSQVIFVSTHPNLINEVAQSLATQLEALPRKELAIKSLAYSRSILVHNNEEAINLINAYAPEHLIICTKDEKYFVENIHNAGSVFLGNYTPESAGDYASGTNHTLPTNGAARAYSGVSLDSFYKKITFQKITATGITHLGPTIEIMAENEDLFAHKNAVSIRLKKLNA